LPVVALAKDLAAVAVLVALAASSSPARADPSAVALPRPLAGPHPVACSNIEQDYGRIPSGEPIALWWEGVPRDDGSGRYLTELLTDPAHTLIARFTAPDDRELFGPWRDQSLTYVLLACYPTSAANARADYALPDGRLVPKMQRGAEPPILPDGGTRLPLVVLSHGYAGSPLGDAYLRSMAVFASHGYVVVAPFHGDARYAMFGLDNVASMLREFERYTALQSTRPLSASAAVDVMLTHPQWRDRVDAARIGIFGASMGGETALLVGGAELTTSVTLSSKRVVLDPRFRGAVGYVPYFGQRILPAYGRDNRGTENVGLPYLAISGTADIVAPIGPAEDGVHRLDGSRALVALNGTEHGLRELDAPDVFTWALEWLDAFVADDRAARARVSRMQRVAGGGDDVLRIDYVAPSAAAPGERIAIEYHNAALDHYFVTAEPAEAAMLDAGVVVPGWQRTGYAFKTYAPGAPEGLPACRFFGTPGIGPSSHFFTIDAPECAKVQANPAWTFEGLAFQADAPGVGTCPGHRAVVTRLYNDGKGGQANHRYTTSHEVAGDMVGEGWIVEGPVFCTPP
jgi:dienelactone hydrolase